MVTFYFGIPPRMPKVFAWVTAGITVALGLQYIVLGLKQPLDPPLSCGALDAMSCAPALAAAPGVVVLSVRPRTPAATAGAQAGLRPHGHQRPAAPGRHRFSLRERQVGDAPAARPPGSRAGRGVERRGADWGFDLEPPQPSEIATCANKCVFCFIHQLPRGMRKSLYVKDDDFRLSFLHGNYITLTDLDEDGAGAHRGAAALAALRLRPRDRPGAAPPPPRRAEGQARAAARHGAPRPCGHPHARADRALPGLERRRAPRPIGARAGAAPPRGRDHGGGAGGPHAPPPAAAPAPARSPMTRRARSRRRSTGWQRALRASLGTRFVWAADELYLQAGRPLPPARAYEGFAIAEDGVGLVRRFTDGWRRAGRRRAGAPRAPRTVTVVTGEMFAPRLRAAPRRSARGQPAACGRAHRNDWFGARHRRGGTPHRSGHRVTARGAATSATTCSFPPSPCATGRASFSTTWRRPTSRRPLRHSRDPVEPTPAALIRALGARLRLDGRAPEARPMPPNHRHRRPAERRQVHPLQPARRSPALARARRARRHPRSPLRHRGLRAVAGRRRRHGRLRAPTDLRPRGARARPGPDRHRGGRPHPLRRGWTRRDHAARRGDRVRPAAERPPGDPRREQGGWRRAGSRHSASAIASASPRCCRSPPSTGGAWPSCSRRRATARPSSTWKCPARACAWPSSGGPMSASRPSSMPCSATSASSCTRNRARRATPWTPPVTFRDRPYVLIDTAGIRRKGKVSEALEKLSVVMALKSLERTDVAVARPRRLRRRDGAGCAHRGIRRRGGARAGPRGEQVGSRPAGARAEGRRGGADLRAPAVPRIRARLLHLGGGAPGPARAVRPGRSRGRRGEEAGRAGRPAHRAAPGHRAAADVGPRRRAPDPTRPSRSRCRRPPSPCA